MQETQHSTTPAPVLSEKHLARNELEAEESWDSALSSAHSRNCNELKWKLGMRFMPLRSTRYTQRYRIDSDQDKRMGGENLRGQCRLYVYCQPPTFQWRNINPLRFKSPLAGGCKRNGKTIPKSSRSDPSVSQAKGGSVTLVTFTKSCQTCNCTLIEKRSRRFKTPLLHKRKSNNFIKKKKTFAIKLATSRREGERNCLENEMSFISSCW